MDMTMFEWPTKAKVESTDYVAICDADGNEKKIAVDDLKNIQKIGQCVQHQMDIFIPSHGLNSLVLGKKPFRQLEIFPTLIKNGWII